MSGPRKTAIVTGASQGIGAGIVKGFVERGFNVVANSRKVTQSTEVAASDHVALVDGHIGEPATAAKIVETALSRFKSIDALVNNAGIFFTKPFTDYTAEDFKSLVSTNLEGFLYVTQLAIKQMLAQKTGGSIVTITAALARNPIRGVTAAVPMITKGGLETITQHLAMEYAKDGIRVNAVAPGAVYTPLHRDTPKDVMESLSPMGRPSTVKDITDAVMYLTDAATVTGDILYVDGGAHFGRWYGAKGGPHENDSNHCGSGADGRKRFGAARGVRAAAGNQAHRSPAARSQRPRTRGRPGARRFRAGSVVPQAHASGRRDHLCPRRYAGISGRGQAAGDAQGRRGLVHSGRNDPRGEERRQRQRGGARHVCRRKREAAHHAGQVSASESFLVAGVYSVQ